MEKDIILVSSIINGSYITDSNNLGHEFINLFKDDNGDFYVYINPHGVVDKNKIKRIKRVVFVKTVSGENKRKFKIVGYADIPEVFDNINQIADSVKYDGIPLPRFFDGNEHASLEYEQNFITFKASTIRLSKKAVELSSEETGITIGQSMFTYLFKPGSKEEKEWIAKRVTAVNSGGDNQMLLEKRAACYKQFDEFHNNKDYDWEDADKLSFSGENVQFEKINNSLLSLLKKNYDENIISDLIVFYLKQSIELTRIFLKEVLGHEDLKEESSEIKITREKEKRIDIFCETNKNIYVIENKIKAGLTKSEIKQEDIDFISEDDSIKNVIPDNDNFCQLTKYYIYVNKKEDIKEKKKHFFIFAPDYSSVFTEKNKYIYGDRYIEIKYSKIYIFFNSHYEIIKDMPHVSEFMAILSLQKEKDILMFEQKRRAKKAADIYKAKRLKDS